MVFSPRRRRRHPRHHHVRSKPVKRIPSRPLFSCHGTEKDVHQETRSEEELVLSKRDLRVMLSSVRVLVRR